VGFPAREEPAAKRKVELLSPLLASLSNRWSRSVDNALWVSSHGSPMTEMAIYDRIRQHTESAFGKAINPHLFRDAAATTLAIADPENVRIAAPLLGHRTFTTTERYYQQARGFEAHTQYIDALYRSGACDEAKERDKEAQAKSYCEVPEPGGLATDRS